MEENCMNKLKKMIIVSIISSIMLTCLFTLNVQAKSDFKPLNDSDSIITYNQSIGRSAQSTNELFSHYQNFNASQPILSDIKIKLCSLILVDKCIEMKRQLILENMVI